MVECPEFVIAGLLYLDSEMRQVVENRGEKYVSPFDNTGEYFKNDVFEVRAFVWDEDSPESKLPNFKCRDFEVRWYKYFGRGMEINRPITANEFFCMLEDCLKSIRVDSKKCLDQCDLRRLSEEIRSAHEILKNIKNNISVLDKCVFDLNTILSTLHLGKVYLDGMYDNMKQDRDPYICAIRSMINRIEDCKRDCKDLIKRVETLNGRLVECHTDMTKRLCSIEEMLTSV